MALEFPKGSEQPMKSIFKKSPEDGDVGMYESGEIIPADKVLRLFESHQDTANVEGPLTGPLKWRGQTFTIGKTSMINRDVEIKEIALLNIRNNNPTTIQARIYNVDGDHKPTGTPLSFGIFDPSFLPTTGFGGRGVYKIAVTAVSLSKGVEYALVWNEPANTSGADNIISQATNLSVYPDGFALFSTDDTSTWSTDNSFSFIFEIWGIYN